jgi:radical SAM protein with 4Fe4S-binding SPASM domain
MPGKNTLVDAPFILVPQHFGSTVFDRGTSKYLPFDTEATDLLRRSAITPFPALAARLGTAAKRDQAAAFFSHFYLLGFFNLDGLFTGALLDVPPSPDFLTGPLAVHLEIVAACNLSCTHCFAGALPRQEKPLTLIELDALFASMARVGSFRLGLTGGEPLLRRDLFDIIDLAASHGLHPCITTNGLLITEEVARAFGSRKMVWVNVSLEGATAETNDNIRGAGTFERVMDKLALLSRHSRFTLAFTILRTNAGEVEACARLAERVGASAAVFRPLYPVGIARRHLDELMPTFTQYDSALASLCGLPGADARVIDPFSPHLREETRASTQSNYGCGAGNSVCSISVSGDVSPCSFLGPAFAASNVRERPFEEIWREGNTFRDIRALPGGTAETFSGGCRARALVLNGSANAPDPWMDEREAGKQRASPITFYHPAVVVEITQPAIGDP